jgi:transcriptional regulator with XRE-family HTH domain
MRSKCRGWTASGNGARAKGLSQEKFGFERGLDRTSVVIGIERGARNPTLVTIGRIAAARGTTPGKMLVEAERGSPGRK